MESREGFELKGDVIRFRSFWMSCNGDGISWEEWKKEEKKISWNSVLPAPWTPLCTSLLSLVMSLKISHSGKVYAMKICKSCRSGVSFLSFYFPLSASFCCLAPALTLFFLPFFPSLLFPSIHTSSFPSFLLSLFTSFLPFLLFLSFYHNKCWLFYK